MDFSSRLRDLPVLETSRLILRRLSLDDAESMFDYARLPRTSIFCSWDYHRSIADTRAFLEFWVSGYGTDSVRDWAVLEKASGRMVGTGGYAQFDPATGTVSFATAPGNGVAVRAGFEFDVPVRFDSDALDVTLDIERLGSITSIPLLELRR